MILVDTNVISEPLRPPPDPAVVSCTDAQNIETLYLAAISLAELRFGVAALPDRKRKDSLRENLERRVVSWDPSAPPPRVAPGPERPSRFLLHRALFT